MSHGSVEVTVSQGRGPKEGAQKKDTVFIDGYPSMIFIDGPSMNINDGYPSMIFIDGYPSMNINGYPVL